MRLVKFKVVRMKQSIEGKITYISCYAGGIYSKIYNKDEVVTGNPSTLGIMTFDKRHQAESFLNPRNSINPPTLHIKRVLPIGRGKRPSLISRYQQRSDIRLFYSNYFHNNFERMFESITTAPPEGTICYPAVKVLD